MHHTGRQKLVAIMNIMKCLLFISLCLLACNPSQKLPSTPSSTTATTENPAVVKTDTDTEVDTDTSSETQPGNDYQLPAPAQSMLDEINLLRADPPAYIPLVEAYLRAVQSDPTWDNAYKKAEMEAGQELIEELRKTPKLSQLSAQEGLYLAAMKHGKDVKKQGQITHTGSDGSQPYDRIKAQAPTMVDGSENLVSGATNVREGMMILLVDSGVPGRGHRVNLLQPKWESAACYEIGEVDGLNGSWVQLFGTENDRPDALAASEEPVEIEEGPADYSFMNEDERSMLEEINLMRADPQGYIPFVEAYVEEFKKAGWDAASTDDEVATAKELIAELKKLEPLSQLRPHQDLYEVAKLHGQDLRQMGQIQHQGSDGSMPYNRVRQGTDLTDGNENIVGGTTFIRESVITLLVDSGIPNRGHRKALLEPKWDYVACYRIGQVGIMPNTWLQVFGAR